MIEENDILLMRELVRLQQARAANWKTPTRPVDAQLESDHAIQILGIQKQLSARAIDPAPGTSEAPPASATIRGGCAEAAGNLFRRWIRRILPQKQNTDTKHI